MKLGLPTILAVAAISLGCAFAPQAVIISPQVNVQASDVGADRSVNLNVVDERPRKTLGTRGVRGGWGRSDNRGRSVGYGAESACGRVSEAAIQARNRCES